MSLRAAAFVSELLEDTEKINVHKLEHNFVSDIFSNKELLNEDFLRQLLDSEIKSADNIYKISNEILKYNKPISYDYYEYIHYYYYDNKIYFYIFCLDFLIQFYKIINMYINNNYILDSSIYNKEFNIKLFYEIKNDYVLFVKNGYDVKFKINKPLYNKISINNIETANVNLTQLLSKIVDNFELIDMTDSNKYYMRYVYYDNLKVRLQYILLETLKKNLREINSSGYISNKSIINKNIEISDEIFIKLLQNKNINYDKLIETTSKLKSDENETKQVKDAIQNSLSIKNTNENVLNNKNKIEKIEDLIKIKKDKILKLKLLFVCMLLIFIVMGILLLQINKIKNKKFVYITPIIIIVIYVICYYYLYNNKKYYEEFTTETIDDLIILNNSKASELLVVLNYNKLYYNNINPVLKKELKKTKNKDEHYKLYKKIKNSNLNTIEKDIKYYKENIMYFINLTLLFTIILVLISVTEKYNTIIYILSLIIFIIMSYIYIYNIIKIVRTKSKNNYWNVNTD